MKIIVIVVTYNGKKWYQKCFDSLKNSTLPVDVIIVDNQSQDDTIDYIRTNYPDFELLESGGNIGFGKANNLGFEKAVEKKADYIFLINQDAWINPDTIELLVKKMEENPEYGVLSPVHISAKGRLDFNFPNYIEPDACPDLIDDLLIKQRAEDKIYPIKFINAAFWMISSKCLNEIGGFNPLFPHYGEDNEYLIRVHYHGFKVGIYPNTFGVHDRERSILSVKNQRKRFYVNDLAVLLDIRIPFSNSLVKIILASTERIARDTFTLSFRRLKWDVYNFVKAIGNLVEIRKKRRLTQKGGSIFLNGHTI